MEKITFASADSQENEEFFVLEQTKLNGVSYILVTDSEEDDAECWILKDTSPEESSEAIYEFVEDEKELNGIMGVFEELLEDDRRRRDDLALLVHVLDVLQRHGANLLLHRLEVGAAVLAQHVAILFEALEILADSRLGNAEGGRQLAHPRTAFLLQPFENLHAPGLGEQTGEGGGFRRRGATPAGRHRVRSATIR